MILIRLALFYLYAAVAVIVGCRFTLGLAGITPPESIFNQFDAADQVHDCLHVNCTIGSSDIYFRGKTGGTIRTGAIYNLCVTAASGSGIVRK